MYIITSWSSTIASDDHCVAIASKKRQWNEYVHYIIGKNNVCPPHDHVRAPALISPLEGNKDIRRSNSRRFLCRRLRTVLRTSGNILVLFVPSRL